VDETRDCRDRCARYNRREKRRGGGRSDWLEVVRPRFARLFCGALAPDFIWDPTGPRTRKSPFTPGRFPDHFKLRPACSGTDSWVAGESNRSPSRKLDLMISGGSNAQAEQGHGWRGGCPAATCQLWPLPLAPYRITPMEEVLTQVQSGEASREHRRTGPVAGGSGVDRAGEHRYLGKGRARTRHAYLATIASTIINQSGRRVWVAFGS